MNKKETESGFSLARMILANREDNLEIGNELEGEPAAQIHIFHL